MGGNSTELRIAEALAARLCHELVSPVGAIANGAEILEQDPDFAADAAKLIGQSAAQASIRLQFYRLAYGAVAEVSADAARTATLALFEEGRCRCLWPATTTIAKELVKPVMNLLLVAVGTLPRGGEVILAESPGGIAVIATGAGARIDAALPGLFVHDVASDQIGAQTVQAIFTAALARRLGFALSIAEDGPDRVILRLEPLPLERRS